ncbi:hypothetical protein NW762_014722 [Fusarium torreyae]|uniref:Uncharacterized protein n=1 Tax=Fusarium torreyae TaxID=1237075 RepID=A0A9W8RLS6_9HYPO|nr:hypothetical protein NW762_014722 [Fusarium torreyae]
MWWELVRQLWNKIDEVYDDSYAWMTHSLQPRRDTRALLDAGIMSQEDKNTLLYTSVTEENYLFWPHFYGTLDRLVIDRQQDLGADINAFSGENGHTILYEICDQINRAYVKDEADDVSSDFKDPKKAALFRVKLKEFCLSLVDKGADPGLHVSDLTAADVLCRGTQEASEENQAYLADLALEMQKTRKGFLKDGPTPSTLVKRADLFSLVPPSDSWSLSGYRPSGRSEWLD